MEQESSTCSSPKRWCAGNVEIDLEEKQVYRHGAPVELRPKVWLLLITLLRKPRALVSARDLMAAVWPNQDMDPKLLVNVASELRRVLGLPQALRAVPRRGYVLEAQPVFAVAQSSKGGPLTPAGPNASTALDLGASTSARGSFVGREAELVRLFRALEIARQGITHHLEMVGVPGVGKTRLVDEFLSKVAGQRDLLVMRGAAISLVGDREPFGPLLQMLQDHLAGSPEGVFAQDIRRLAPCWSAQIPGLLDTAALEPLRRDLHMSTEGRMRREFTHLIQHWASRQTLILVLEDLHWADVSTLDWLKGFQQSTVQARILVVGTWRPHEHIVWPEGHHRIDWLRWMLSDRVERFDLKGLCADEARRFIQCRLGAEAATDELVDRLHQCTGGLPLLLEIACRDTGLVRLQSLPPPAQQQLSAAALMDRLRQWIVQQGHQLDQGQKLLCQVASCAAMPWPLPLLAQVLAMPERDIVASVDSLVAKGGLKAWSGPSPWDGALVRLVDFSHAMYREAIQASLNDEQRRALCRRIAAVVLPTASTALPGMASTLALILSGAGRHTEAANILRAHGAYSLQRFSSQQAIRSMSDALAELDRTPRSIERLALQLEIAWPLATILALAKGHHDPSVAEVQKRILVLAGELHSPRARFIAALIRCSAAFFRYGDSADAGAGHIAGLTADLVHLGWDEQQRGWFWAGLMSVAQGRIVEGARHFQACVDVVEPDEHALPGEYRMLGEAELVWCLGVTGDFGQFRRRLKVLEEERRAQGNPFLFILTLFITADALRLLGCLPQARKRYAELLQLCDREEQHLLKPVALACAEGCRPAAERDLALLEGLARRAPYGRHWAVVIYVDTLLSTNRVAEAADFMSDDALMAPARHSINRTQTLRLQGDLLERTGRRQKAAALWLRALATDLQHRFLPGVIGSLQRLRGTGVAFDDANDDLFAWADDIDHSLLQADAWHAPQLEGPSSNPLRPLLAGLEVQGLAAEHGASSGMRRRPAGSVGGRSEDSAS